MVNFFSKINTSLKSSATNGFSIPNIGFLIGDLYDSIFGFFEKSAILKDFVRNCTSNILCIIEVSNRSILKNYIYSLLDLLKQMSFHIVVIKIRLELAEIEFAKKNFQNFHLWVAFLTEYFTCIVEGFLRGSKSDLVLEMDWFDPK